MTKNLRPLDLDYDKDSNKPVVSLLVPFHNSEKYLDFFLDCYQSQTIKKSIELVAVDDGSTDETLSILRFAAKNDRSIKIFEIQKTSPEEARNFALSKAMGELIITIDSDDGFSPDYIEGMVKLFISADLDVVVSSYRLISETNKIGNKRHVCCKTTQIFKNNEDKIAILKSSRYGGWNRMTSKQFLNKISYDYTKCELPLYIAQFYNDVSVGYTDVGTYYYRVNPTSISRKNVSKHAVSLHYERFESWMCESKIEEPLYSMLGIYITRMMIPYCLYHANYDPSFDWKSEIKHFKNINNYSFRKALRYFWVLSARDKVVLLPFMFHIYFPAFIFIKRKRS